MSLLTHHTQGCTHTDSQQDTRTGCAHTPTRPSTHTHTQACTHTDLHQDTHTGVQTHCLDLGHTHRRAHTLTRTRTHTQACRHTLHTLHIQTHITHIQTHTTHITHTDT